MMVGWGGNNGSTLTGGILANKHGLTWMTRSGLQTPNYFGSLTQAATCRVGNFNGEEVHAPFKALLPMAEPNELVLGGWDISNFNLADAMERAQVGDKLLHDLLSGRCLVTPLAGCTPTLLTAFDAAHCQVLDFELQRQLVPYMKDMVPLPGIYDQDFVAANQVRVLVLLVAPRSRDLETNPGRTLPACLLAGC